MKSYRSTLILAAILLVLSVLSLFVGVINVNMAGLMAGDLLQWQIFLVSRLPRLLAILCTGIGMSVAGLIMQQLCSNKFVSPTTGATISSAQFGILLALLFLPDSTLWGRALFAFAAAVLGTWVFVWFIPRIRFKDAVMVPLVGIMFGNVIGGASIVFQSIINNTIVTPCLLGMNSLYTLIHTAVVFFLGSGSIVAVNANLSFAVDVVLMGIAATVIHSWLFKKATTMFSMSCWWVRFSLPSLEAFNPP